jgi:guanylate kinase
MFEQSSPLKHLSEFQRVLKGYNPNLELLDLITDKPFVLLAAPTAAGRNTIVKNLIMTGRYYYVISDTTRRPRINNGVPETNGNEYWFKSEEEFLQGLKNNAYIEAALIHNQQVSGISVQELRHASKSGAIPITDVDIQGCDTIMSISDKVMPIFILPPDFPEWMSRLDGRGVMDKEEKMRRLTSATAEIELALDRSYFRFTVNYDLRVTIETLHEHIISGQFGEIEQSNARTHAEQLLSDLGKYLQTY